MTIFDYCNRGFLNWSKTADASSSYIYTMSLYVFAHALGYDRKITVTSTHRLRSTKLRKRNVHIHNQENITCKRVPHHLNTKNRHHVDDVQEPRYRTGLLQVPLISFSTLPLDRKMPNTPSFEMCETLSSVLNGRVYGLSYWVLCICGKCQRFTCTSDS